MSQLLDYVLSSFGAAAPPKYLQVAPNDLPGPLCSTLKTLVPILIVSPGLIG